MMPLSDLPRNHFGCILLDPPWSFKSYSGKSAVPTQAADPYSTMSLADLKALPVGDVAAKDCLMLMWTVSHLQDEASEVARAWGFTPKSLGLIWDKSRVGMGYWFRQEMEVQKLFTRGSPKRLNADVRQGIREPRREHSRKPDEQYDRIERLVGGPYLEMFARQSRPGWTTWGAEATKFDPATAADDLADLLGPIACANDLDADLLEIIG